MGTSSALVHWHSTAKKNPAFATKCIYVLSVWTHGFLFYLMGYNPLLSLIFFKDFIYLFSERRREGERKGQKQSVWLPLQHPILETCPATQAYALTGNRTSDPLVCSPALNPLSHLSQGIIINFYVQIFLDLVCGNLFKLDPVWEVLCVCVCVCVLFIFS